MNRREAVAIGRLWRAFRASRDTINNQAYREFVFGLVAADPRLRHINCFEVLDAVTNQAAWVAYGKPTEPCPRSITRAARAEPRQASEHRAGGETGSTRVVEVEEAAY